MRRRAALACILAAVVLAAPGSVLRPAPAHAGIGSVACGVLGTVGEGWWGKACNAVLSVGQKVIGAGKKVASVIGKVGSNPLVQRAAGIAAIVAWVLGGAKWTMDHMASVISHSTSPALDAQWFTGVYLRVEGLALFFTLLFVCAAAAEAILRSESGVLARAVLGYLPLAALLTAIAVPVTMLLLAASDELSAGLARVAGQGTIRFLTGTTAWITVGLTAADPFFAVLAGGLVVAAAGALWVELLLREVAVYVVVGMLPLVFAAMVWPARRVWAIRAVEVLVALILAKVAIVAVLALGGAALADAGAGGLTRLLAGLALIVLGAFSPWLLLRLIPLAEVASAAVGHIRGHLHATTSIRTPEAVLASKAAAHTVGRRNGGGHPGSDALIVQDLLEQMHRRAQAAENGADPGGRPPIAAVQSSSVTRTGLVDVSESASRNGQVRSGNVAGQSSPAVAPGQAAPQRPDDAVASANLDLDPPAPPAHTETADETSATTPSPPPDPQERRLLGDDEGGA